jgi:hypothetical protein
MSTGLEAGEDWFDDKLANHPEFLRRIRNGRADFIAGLSKRLEDIPERQPSNAGARPDPEL